MLIIENKVLVLMASFNGSKYIKEQIESIQNQTIDDWTLIIRDDGSSDDSISIINKIIEQDKRIYLLKDSYGSTGKAQLNFYYLLEYAKKLKPDYIFLSDQDDVWLPYKLDRFISAAKNISNDNSIPLLVHSDLEVVDDNLDVIASSFASSVGLDPNKKNQISTLAFQNFVTGCACMINSELLEKITPIPKNIMMHDWWLALVASAFGEIIYIPEVLVKYRQHCHNAVGSLSYLPLCNPLSKLGRNAISTSQYFIENCYEQIVNLRERLICEGYDTSEVDALLNSARLNRFHRIVYLLQHDCLPSGKGRIIGFMIRHLLTPKSTIQKYEK